MLKSLPADVRAYRRTPEFTEATIPKGLLNEHTTKPGVWAVIHVTQGLLEYHILKPEPERRLLTPDRPGIVEPAVPHEVAPLGRVRFYVEFHAHAALADDTGDAPAGD
ncbi:MAG: DUF1971 domain-containing protein [Thiomonas sp.]|uniref:DUF1971 domain-containing protein n=1 Tax=Thiomonas sp. TaxID=2047785 RepID=UPI002A36751F|nr:DUF1971 domain-containing protein [Thiomonas sp.]MDY0331035.1 DUF1971 domain-containing protein [Thiomonas sp.]